MRFYIASKLENHEQVKTLANLLKLSGWEHTFDWTAHISTKETDMEMLKFIGQKEFDGVKNADVVIVLSPQGRGTHVELGMAIAMNKAVYIRSEDERFFRCDENTSAFYWLPNVNHFVGSIEELAEKLLIDSGVAKRDLRITSNVKSDSKTNKWLVRGGENHAIQVIHE